MFNSEDDALDFRDDIVTVLDTLDTDGWLLSPRLDGARIQLGDNVGEVRGTLDGQGYRTKSIEPADGWADALKVEP